MKHVKQGILSALCLLVVGLSVLGLIACDQGECTHQWGDWTVTTDATCVEDGVQTRSCAACGEIQTDVVAAIGHDWVQASCTVPMTCRICSTTQGTATAHVYDQSVVTEQALKSAATCRDAAVYYKSCVCGLISTDDADTFISGEPIAHQYVVEAVKEVTLKSAATCDSPAVYYKSCACGAIDINSTFTSGKPAAHSYTLEVVKDEALKSAASCTSAAVYYKSCACGAVSTSATDTFKSGALPTHTYTLEVVKNEALASAANCMSAAVYYKSCACGAISTSSADIFVSGVPTGHSYIYAVVKADALMSVATCASPAMYYKSCVCGAVSTKAEHAFASGSALAHSYVYEVIRESALKTPGTCMSAAVYYKSCVCGAISKSATDTFLGSKSPLHNYTVSLVRADALQSAATCQSAAIYYKSCVCGAISTSAADTFKSGAPLNHTYDRNEVKDAALKSAATCESAAVYYKSCSCGAISTNEADIFQSGVPLAHSYTQEVVKNEALKSAASCTSAAVYYKSCVCGLVSTNETEIFTNGTPASHTHEVVSSTEADCLNAATKTYRCGCGDEYTETVGDKLGHSTAGVTPEERQVAGSTCEYVLIYACDRSDCGEEIEGEHVFHHNHVATITQAATCKADGVKTLRCVCGDTKTEPIPMDATGHSWTRGTVENGVRTDTCSLCGETKSVVSYDGTTTDETNADALKGTEIELNDANISMDDGVIDTIGDKSVTISAEKVEGADRADLGLSAEELSQVGDSPIYNFTISDGTSTISQFGAENWVTITLPYTLAEGEDVDSIAIWFINDEGALESISATYNNGFVTFRTNHFSYYTVTRLTPVERCALYGHSYVTQTHAGSCTEDAYDLLLCVRCHESHKENVVVADGHDYVCDAHEATCTEDGYAVYTCEDCAHSYRVKLNATGHGWTVTAQEASTCSENGYTTYTCADCEQSYTEVLPKLAHDIETTVVPVSCEQNGYTTYACKNCDYSSTDAVVEALGHDYEMTWRWADDYRTATLVLTCLNDATHEVLVAARVKVETVQGTCSDYSKTTYTATAIYDGAAYTDSKITQVGTPDHTFATEWTFDKDNHWHACVCGERTDVSAHDYQNETVTTPPTCAEAGEKTAYCDCGATRVTVVPATKEHVYENGACVGCGRSEALCEHTVLHESSMDFGAYGTCDFTLYYLTCDCGEVVMIDTERSLIPCDLEILEQDQSTDADGNVCMTAVGVCADCGMRVDISAVRVQEGCLITMRMNYIFSLGDVIILENAVVEQTDSDHSSVQETIDLSVYGECGGVMIVERCTACDTITELREIEPECPGLQDAEPETVVDDDGIKHTVLDFDCPDCTLRFVLDYWTEIRSACETVEHETLTVYAGNDVLAQSKLNSYDSDHNYTYEYELQGEVCADGVKVIANCDRCGDSYDYMTSGHPETDWRVIEMGDLGLCDGKTNEQYCIACDTVLHASISDSCPWQYTGENENGYEVYECSACGATKLMHESYSEKNENCQLTCHQIRIYLVDGQEVYRYEREYRYDSHEYSYEFVMNGASCTEGYTVIYTCRNCAHSYNRTSSYHETYRLFSLDAATVGCCEDHTIEFYSCPCGYEYYYYLSEENFEYDNQSGYTCGDCGLTLNEQVTSLEDGCSVEEITSITVTCHEEELYRYTGTVVCSNHNFSTVSVSMAGGVPVITRSCQVCGEVHESEIKQVALQGGDEGEYYFDFTVTPTISSTYTIISLEDRDTCVTLYVMGNNGMETITSNDDGGYGGNFMLSTYLEAGKTYVYRIRNYDRKDDTAIRFLFSEGDLTGSVCRHADAVEFAVLSEGADSCEDGALFGSVCVFCGQIRNLRTTTDHETYRQNIIDLKEFGACFGEFYYFSCACGREGGVQIHSCYDRKTSNVYYDEEGRLIHVEALTCSTCGLRYDLSYYTVRDPKTCTQMTYYTVMLTIGNKLVVDQEYAVSSIAHDYMAVGTLAEGATSCYDGVVITYTCRDCDDTYSTTFTWHKQYERERIQLSTYGSVCGGYAVLSGCACGEYSEMSLEHSLCELGVEYCNLWVENTITDQQHTINGWTPYHYQYTAHLYTCAVTDPAERACAYKIRYASYWVHDKDACMAYQYETWQFGYNEDTGEYQYEVTFRTGSSGVYHTYVTTRPDNGVEHDCSACGSYYHEYHYYDSQDRLMKYERTIYHALADRNRRYDIRVDEYSYDEDGTQYLSREYRKIVYADGEEFFESVRVEQPFEGSFGSDGKTGSYTENTSGVITLEEEYAYVIYKGYRYDLYSYRTEQEMWSRYDYSYTFEDGCMQTTEYSDSYGEHWTKTSDYCRYNRWVVLHSPTCTQDGQECVVCVICGKQTKPTTIDPNDHNWVQITDGWYYCFTCGLENANGVSGDIVMEDLTDSYGNGQNYVVGYWARNDVTFTYYVSLMLEDGSEVVLDGIDFFSVDGLRSVAFSKAAVAAAAQALGYESDSYDVRFAFVPYGADGSFDYAITFTEMKQTGVIVDDVSFIDYVGSGETVSFTVMPSQSGVWTFTTCANSDTYGYLYDADGNLLAEDDDGGVNANFSIAYTLEANTAYTVCVRWYHAEYAGNMPLLFTWVPVEQ